MQPIKNRRWRQLAGVEPLPRMLRTTRKGWLNKKPGLTSLLKTTRRTARAAEENPDIRFALEKLPLSRLNRIESIRGISGPAAHGMRAASPEAMEYFKALAGNRKETVSIYNIFKARAMRASPKELIEHIGTVAESLKETIDTRKLEGLLNNRSNLQAIRVVVAGRAETDILSLTEKVSRIKKESEGTQQELRIQSLLGSTESKETRIVYAVATDVCIWNRRLGIKVDAATNILGKMCGLTENEQKEVRRIANSNWYETSGA